MSRQNLDRMAYAGCELPPGLPGADALYFEGMRWLYHSGVSPEQGSREKAEIQRVVREYESGMEMVLNAGRLFARTEQARIALRKARTTEERLEAADRLLEAIDHVPVNRQE